MRGTNPAVGTPSSWCVGRAGFNSGPMRLNRVRAPSSFRMGMMRLKAGWKVGAKRKTKFFLARAWGTASGSTVRGRPRASTTSAEPQVEETERLPCLTTLCPMAARYMATAVEQLNEQVLSPPGAAGVDAVAGQAGDQTGPVRGRRARRRRSPGRFRLWF